MIPFVMSPEIEAQLKGLFELADKPERRISLDRLREAAQGFNPEDPKTHNKESIYPLDQTIEMPFGWKVTFSIEEQPMGWCRHVSMSACLPGRAPGFEAMDYVLEHLGFRSRVNSGEMDDDCHIYPEHYESGRSAINLIEVMEP